MVYIKGVALQHIKKRLSNMDQLDKGCAQMLIQKDTPKEDGYTG